MAYQQNVQMPYLQDQVSNSHRPETPPTHGMSTTATVSLVIGSILMLVLLINLVAADAFLIHLLETSQ